MPIIAPEQQSDGAFVRRLKRLERTISVSIARPLRDERGWAFPGDRFHDAVNGFELLAEAYERSEPGYDARRSGPVLWDRHEGRIVNNESEDIMRMLNRYLTGDRVTEADWRLFVTLVRFDAVYHSHFSPRRTRIGFRRIPRPDAMIDCVGP